MWGSDSDGDTRKVASVTFLVSIFSYKYIWQSRIHNIYVFTWHQELYDNSSSESNADKNSKYRNLAHGFKPRSRYFSRIVHTVHGFCHILPGYLRRVKLGCYQTLTSQTIREHAAFPSICICLDRINTEITNRNENDFVSTFHGLYLLEDDEQNFRAWGLFYGLKL